MDHKSSLRWIVAFVGACLFAFPLAAFGQSDPANFTTVINLPADELPQEIDPSTQINVGEGSIISNIQIGTDVELNVVGGRVHHLVANAGGTINVNAGTVYQLPVYAGEVHVRGGFVGEIVHVYDNDGLVELVGGEFRLNGAPLAGTSVHAVYGDLLTGTLSDGSPFIFSPPLGSAPHKLDATLTSVALPSVDLTPIVLDGANPTGPRGLRPGQSLTLLTGGVLNNDFVAVGATLNVDGGQLGDGIEFSESVVNYTAGSGGANLNFYRSEFNLSGGSLGYVIELHDGSVFNMSGGSTDFFFRANSGSTVNISGGKTGVSFLAEAGSTINITGGSIGAAFAAAPGSDVEFVGGEFEINGAAFAGTVANLGANDVLSGVFSDGTPFIFSELRNPVFANSLNDSIASVTLTNTALPPVSLAPIVVDAATESVPAGLRAGQSLTVKAGGVLDDNFSVIRATLDVEGGVVGDWGDVTGGSVDVSSGEIGLGFSVLQGSVAKISGGKVGGLFNASAGSRVIVTGGEIGSAVNANDGSQFYISDGEIGSSFQANSGSVVNISGGDVAAFFHANSGSRVNISGGSMNTTFVKSGSTFNLFGTEFRLDGELIEELTLNEAFTIADRGRVKFSGLLADGSSFEYQLNLFDNNGQQDSFAADALLTITLVSDLAGDYNNDGVVDAADYTVWRNHVGAPAGSLLNDVDGGEIGAAQYATWRANYSASAPMAASSPTPEPSTLLLLTAACLFGLLPRRRAKK